MTSSSWYLAWLPPRDSTARKGLRGAVVVILFGVLFYWIPVERTLSSLAGLSFLYLFLALLLRFFMFTVSAAKLWLLSPEIDNDPPRPVPYPDVFSVYLTARFFSNFLPTSVGGDVIKVRELQLRNQDWEGSTAGVFLERFSGIVAVALMAVFVSLPGLGLLEPFGLGFLRYPFLALSGLTLLLVVWKGKATLTQLAQLLNTHENVPGVQYLRRFMASLERYQDRTGTLASVIVLSLVYHLIRCGYLLAGLLALGQGVSYIHLLPVVPIVTFVSLIPVSLGSLGLREGALTFCLTALGVRAPEALATALLTRFIGYGYSLIGGLLYVIKPQSVSDS